MAEQFEVSPRGLRAVGEDVAELSSRIKAVLESLGGQLAGEGAGVGCALVPGDANDFHGSYRNVQSTVDADTGVVDYWADYLKHAADVSEQSDQS